MSWDSVIDASKDGDGKVLAKALENSTLAVVNASDEHERTALSWACANGHAACVQMLLKKRADPSRVDAFDYTALHEACSFGHERCVRLLLDGNADPNSTNNVDEAPIHIAVSRGQVGCAALLLSNGAFQNRTCHRGLPIHVACQFGRRACIELLLRVGPEGTSKRAGASAEPVAMGRHLADAIAPPPLASATLALVKHPV
jgi:ankyrin repeat protein